MDKRSRRRFTKEFKAETVALIRQSGKSIAEVCRDMGLSESSVHRWLAQAQLTLEPHPTDARLKGLTRDHLLLLAAAHHRSLPALPGERPAPTAPAETSPELLAELITAL